VKVSDVEEEVASILDIGRHDAETAHSNEDALYLKVLTAIAEGHPEPAGLALVAMKTQTGGFSRWYA